MTRLDLLRDEWIQVAQALGISIVAPFELRDGSDNLHKFACLLPQFGSKRGMLLMADYDREAAAAASTAGFGFSCLDPDPTARPQDAVPLLIDWQWVPEITPPSWYVSDVPTDEEEA